MSKLLCSSNRIRVDHLRDEKRDTIFTKYGHNREGDEGIVGF